MPLDKELLHKIVNNDPTLKELNLSKQEPKLNDEDIEELAEALEKNTSIEFLNLSGNLITDKGAMILAKKFNFKHLNLASNKIGDGGIKALAYSSNLLSLRLMGCAIRTDGIKEFARNSKVIYLNLSNNHLGDEDAIELAQNSYFETLMLGYNNIRDKGVEALALNSKVISLNLCHNPISNEGFKYLARSKTITKLNIVSSGLTDESAKEFICNPIIIELEANSDDVSPAVAEELKQAIQRNQQKMVRNRDQFIQAVITLGRDKANMNSQSSLSKLPHNLILHIINFIDFQSTESIGKSVQQIYQCSEFILKNIVKLNESLAESLKVLQDFKVMEKNNLGIRKFWFHPQPQLMQNPAHVQDQEKSEHSDISAEKFHSNIV